MLQLRHILVLVIVVLLCGCDRGWPPKKERILEHFAEYKSGLETLEARMAESDYHSVWAGGWRQGSDEIPDYVGVGIETDRGRVRTRITGQEAIEWNTAFLNARVWSITNNDRGTRIDLMVPFPKDTSGWVAYQRTTDVDDTWVECRDEFRDVRCGFCTITLEDNWFIRVGWYQYPIDEQALDAYAEGNMPLEELEAIEDELYEQCYDEGAEIIEYPNRD